MQAIVLSEQYSVPTKAEVQEQVASIFDSVQEGLINPLRAIGLLTALEKVAADAKEKIMDFAIEESEKYPEKVIAFQNAKFERVETGVKYDYSVNPTWCDLNEQDKLIKAEMKGLEKTMQMAKAAPRTSKTTVKVTLQ